MWKAVTWPFRWLVITLLILSTRGWSSGVDVSKGKRS
jgi:hypothetical protein